MKRKLLTIMTSILMIMSLGLTCTFAESQPTHIETVAQLKEALRNDLSTAQKTALLETAKEEVVAEFMEEKLDKAAEIINGQNFEADMQMMPDGSAYGTQEFYLGDDCVMTVELSDCAQNQAKNNFALESRASSDSNELWRGYGNRSFTAKTSVSVGGMTTNIFKM